MRADRDRDPSFLVLGFGDRPIDGAPDAMAAIDTDVLIAGGPLLNDDGTAWLGTAMFSTAPTTGDARAALSDGIYAQIEVHLW